MLPQHRAQQPPIPRPCRLLLCGEEDAGQRQVAGALLKLAQEVQVHTVSLPVLVAGGDGDATVGLVQLLQEALHRQVHVPKHMAQCLSADTAWHYSASRNTLMASLARQFTGTKLLVRWYVGYALVVVDFL